jgi:hypothetical protein
MLSLHALATAMSPAPAQAAGGTSLSDTLASWGIPKEVGEIGLKVLLALGLFLALWIFARFVRNLLFTALTRTEIDDKIAEKLGIKALLEESRGDDENALERIVASVVYWVLMLFAVVIVLDYSGLEKASQPIHEFLGEITGALPNIGKAALIFGIAWLAGYVLRKVVITSVGTLGVDRRFGELAMDVDAEDADEKRPFANSAGQIIYWVILFFGFAGAVDALQITVISDPLSNAVDSIISRVPQFGMGTLFFAAGWFLAKVARGIVTNLLEALGLNKLVARIKLDGLFGERKASGVLGILLQFFIVLNAGILALDQVGLKAVSDPLKAMMTEFWIMVPPLLVSALMIFVAVVIGRLVNNFVSAGLDNLGFNTLAAKLGLAKVAERQDKLGKPSDVAGFIAQATIVLLATAQAFENMNLATWRGYVDTLLAFTVQHALIAMVIVVIGFAVGNYVRDMVRARDPGNPWLGELARYMVLVFAVTMALTQLGVAEHFVLLAFGLMFGSLCLAMGLAFGLGSKDVAGEIVRKRYQKMQVASRAAPKPGPSSPVAPPVSSPLTPPTP